MTWQRSKATMATVISAARFIKNFRIYHQLHTEDTKFTVEAMFVMCDPQCHPPITTEQFKKWMEILPL